MTQLTYKHLTDAINEYDVILFDLWGVIVEGEATYPGVIDAVNKVMEKKEVVFLSNAPRPDFIVAKNVGSWGLRGVTPAHVLTSGDIARCMIEEKAVLIDKKSPVVYHLGADRNDDILIEIEHELTEDIDKADIMLLSLYRDDHENITEFDELLKGAAGRPEMLILCSNPDTTIPKQGVLRYCSGYFAELIEKFGGKVIYTGKPKSVIYDKIIKRHSNTPLDRILMVGDTFETDILGANLAGIDSALVMTGNANSFHKMHGKMEDKLTSLYNRAKEVKAMPTFVTKIV